MAWHPGQIPDQTGRTIVVTGANGGLGEVATRILAEKGARVVMACRNREKAQQVADTIPGDVEVAELDLSDLDSIRAFAKGQTECDVLINNAGLMNIPFSRTKDGFETQFGVNHLGHFALTGLLLDKVSDRVVTLASIAHRQTPKLWIDDLNYENRRYQRNLAYAQSKLANLMFARELQRRLEAAGSEKRSYAVHPGVSGTDLFTRTETVFDLVAKQGPGWWDTRRNRRQSRCCSRPPFPMPIRPVTGGPPVFCRRAGRCGPRRRAGCRGTVNCGGGFGRSRNG